MLTKPDQCPAAQVLKLGAQRVLEEVDILKFQELAPNPIQASARSSRGRECQSLLCLVQQLLVVMRPSLYEEPLQSLGR